MQEKCMEQILKKYINEKRVTLYIYKWDVGVLACGRSHCQVAPHSYTILTMNYTKEVSVLLYPNDN